MANRNNVVDILIRARDEATRVLDTARREVEQLERSTTTTGENASRALRRIEDGASSLANRLTRLGVVWSAAITTPLTALGTVGVRSQMQLQTFQASLNVLVGDAERAQKVFDELYEFDTRTTFSWPSLSNATRLLAAFNFEAEEIIPTLGRLGDLSAGVNIGIDEMAEIFGKAKVQQRLFMEDVNQLVGRGIPVVQEFAKQFGVTEDAVRELVSSGQIHFEHLEAAIVSLTSEGGRFHNLMQAQGQTTAGRLLQLRKEFEQLTDQIGAALIPTVDSLIDRGRSAVAWFVNLDESTQKIIITVGMAVAAVGPLAVGLGSVANGVAAVARALPAMRVAFLAMASPPTGWILLAVAGVVALVAALAGRGRDSLTSAVDDARASLAGGDAASLVSSLDRVTGKVDGPVKTALQELQEELRTTGDVGVEMAERIEEALHKAVVQQAQAEVSTASAELEMLRNIQLNSRRATPDEVIGPLRNRLAAFGRADLAMGLTYDTANNRFALPEGTRLGTGRFDMEIIEAISAANRQVADVTGDHAEAITAATDRLTAAWANLERVANPTQPPPTTTPSTRQGQLGGDRGEGAGGTAPRTVDDVLNDLAAAGTAAMRLAAFEGTTEASLQAARTRSELITRAIVELITDHYDEITEAELNGLRERRTIADAEVLLYQQRLDTPSRAQHIAMSSGFLRANEDAGLIGRAEHDRLAQAGAEEAARAFGEWWSLRTATVTAELRAFEDAGLMGRSELQRLALESAVAADRAVGEWFAQRIALTADLRALEDAGLMGRTEHAAAVEAAVQQAEQAAAEWVAFIVAAKSASLRADEDASLMGMTALNESRAAADRAVGEWFAQRIALTADLRALEDAGQAGRAEVNASIEAAKKEADQAAADWLAYRIAFMGRSLREDEDAGTMGRAALQAIPPRQGAIQVTPLGPGEEGPTREKILQEEMQARRRVIEQLTAITSDKGPLANFGAGLLSLASNSIPVVGTALEGFVKAGPWGAIVSIFTTLLGESQAFANFLEAVNVAFAPLVEIIGKLLTPVFTVLATVITKVVDTMISVYNFLLGWLFGRVHRGGDDDPKPPQRHSSAPPTLREVDYSRVGHATQLAVAQPILEAAQLTVLAANQNLAFANRLDGIYVRVEAFYTRLLETGISVHIPETSKAGSSRVSRAAIVRA